MIAIDIAAGVALILFGIRFLRKALDRLFGLSLVEWLQRMTRHRLKAFGGGVAVAMIAPSSTTLSLLTVQMLEAGKLTAQRMLAVTLGVNVGITITVQLLSLRLYEYQSLFLLLGIAGFLLPRRETIRGVGQFLFALGLLFIAMQMIGSAASVVARNPDLRTLSLLLAGHPFLVLIFGAIVALLLQSSTATIGIAIGLAAGGLFQLEVLIPLVLGANLGIAGTAMVAGWNQIEGRRLAAANLLVKALMALVLLLLMNQVAWVARATSGEITHQAANLHTLYNLGVAALALPLITPLTTLFRWIIPASAMEDSPARSRPDSYLDPQFLAAPSLALGQGTRELLLMSDHITEMLQKWYRGYVAGDASLVRQVQQQDDQVDRINAGLKEFLSDLSGETIGQRDSALQVNLLIFANELEAVGDLIDKHLCDHLLKFMQDGRVMDARDRADFEDVFQRLLHRLAMATSILTTRDAQFATLFLVEKEIFDHRCRTIQRDHFERLKAGEKHLLGPSTFFLDALTTLRRINSHLTAVGHVFIPERDGCPTEAGGEPSLAFSHAV